MRILIIACCAGWMTVLGSIIYAATSASVSFDYNSSNGVVDKSKLLNLARGWQGPIHNTDWHNSFYGNMATVGVQELRMDWLVSDSSYHVVRRDGQNNLTYDFMNLDAIILPLLMRGMRPVMCVHMENVAALGITNKTDGQCFPSNLNDYQTVIKTFVQHYKDLGYSGLTWESHNECENFTNLTAEQTYIMYDHFAHGVKQADPTAKVGGPATGSDWFSYMGTFLDYYKSDTSKPDMDFFSYHQYSSETFYSITNAVNLFTSRGLPVPPIYLTEWNDYPFVQTDNDQSQHAAYVSQKIYWAMMHASALTKIYFFNYADGNTGQVFSGENGLFTAGNHKKASANAFNLYNNLHHVRLTPTISGQDTSTYYVYSVATKDPVTGGVSLILWNNRSTDVNVSLSVSNLPYLASSQNFVLTKYIIDSTHGNYYNDYLLNPGLSPTSTAVGASENVGVSEIATLPAASSFSRAEYLPAWSVTQLKFSPVGVFNSSVDYEIINCRSGLNLQINGASQKTEQTSYGAQDNQMWNLVDLGNGYYKIVNKKSGQVLEVPGASTGSGVQLAQAIWTGGNHQQWQVFDAGSFYKLINRNSGLDVHVSGGAQNEGAPIIQSAVGTGLQELWKIQAVRPAPNAACRGHWKLDETTGTLAGDTSGFDKHGTLQGITFTAHSLAGKDGMALNFNGVNNHITVPPLSFYGNTVTVTAWIKCDATAVPWSGIFFSRGPNANGLNICNNRELRYHWNNSKYTWISGLTLPVNVWTFVALVIGPGQGTIYMDSGSGLQSATNYSTHNAELFGSDSYIGWDNADNARHFRGIIDDVRVYNTSFTSSQVESVRNLADHNSPTPSPMTWATMPYESGTGAVTMTASAASDPAGVEYYFGCVSCGGHDSGWQSSATYTDMNLTSVTAQYRVKARDKSPNSNETALSVPADVTISRYSYGIQIRTIPSKLQVEEFDVAGEGLSYHDTTGGNSGGALRVNEDVDIISFTENSMTYYAVDSIESGEWLEYTVNSAAGPSDVSVRIASMQMGGQIKVWLDTTLLATIPVHNTGSLTTWQVASATGLTLPEQSGAKLRLEFMGTGFRLDWITFQQQGSYGAAPSPIPGKIEFEDYDIGGSGIAWYDTTPLSNSYGNYRSDGVDIYLNGGVLSVFTVATEWLEYTVDIIPGIYDIMVCSASSNANQTLTLTLDDQLLTMFNLPITGGWTSWKETSLSGIPIAVGGQRVLRAIVGPVGVNLDSIRFVRHHKPADIDKSTRVDYGDFSILSSQWMSAPGVPSADIAESNNLVDPNDLLMLTGNWLIEE